MDLLAEPAARSIVEQGRHLYVAVAAPAGPHVTPELYSAADGRLWFWSAHDTVKAKVLREHPRASALVRVGDRSVIVSGRTERFDPRDVAALPRALRDPLAVGRATVKFGLRNAADLGAFATDFAKGRLGRSLPPRRVLFGLRPTRLAVVDAGTVLLALGDWAHPGPVDGEPVTRGDQAAVVAWETEHGPLALPGRLDADGDRAWIAPALAGVAGLPPSARVGFFVDDYVAPGPAAKEGRLLRGTGTLGEGGRVDLVRERETEWKGVSASTRKRRSA
jgi:hypothetical protein